MTRPPGSTSGWTARENSFSDGMPVQNERGDITLVFSGEEYPEPNTVQSLKERGHQFKAEGPSYLVHLYEEDPSFPKSLNGRFQGLVSDRTRGVATLFNDRYGMHRLYYHESNDAFYFAVEAKAILAVRPELAAAGSSQPGGICCVRMRIGESDALRGRPRAARRVSLDLSGRLGRDEENIFRAARVGRTRTSGSGILSPGNSGDFFAPFPSLPQRP